uniref:P-type domain-containing protein n=1 Tax=Biomphalaria glabrata TaxID=6526 RepID=A0A2C9LPM8_BIOGL
MLLCILFLACSFTFNLVCSNSTHETPLALAGCSNNSQPCSVFFSCCFYYDMCYQKINGEGYCMTIEDAFPINMTDEEELDYIERSIFLFVDEMISNIDLHPSLNLSVSS